MKKSVVAGMVVLLCGVAGCGSSADGLAKEQIKYMNELADALDAKAPEAKLKELQQKLEESGKKMQELKLSEDEKKKLAERYKDEYTKAGARLAKAGMNRAMGDFGKAFGGQIPNMPQLPPGVPGGGDR